MHKYGAPSPSICTASKKTTERLRKLQQESEINLQSEKVGDVEHEEEEMDELQGVPIELQMSKEWAGSNWCVFHEQRGRSTMKRWRCW